jgi:hypothetical protein
MQEHYDIADWIWNHIHATENTTTPVPAGPDRESEDYSLDGFVLATGLREDHYNTHNHSGTISRQDANHRAQASSGDSVGAGNQEVVALEPLTRIEDHGQPDAEIIRLEFGRRYLFDKP